MYSSSSLLVVFGALIATTCSGAPVLDDIFSGFVRNVNLNSPNKEGGIVKRRIYEENRDAGLKQISLQSLIGNLEHSLYQSALSVGSVADDKDAEVEEVTPAAKGDHAITKRKSEDDTTSASTTEIGHVAAKQHQHHATTEPQPEERKILLQTTQKVPANHEGTPTHVLIDHISVQPHFGGVPLIPAFQVYHKKVTTATIQEPNSSNQTQISITQTDIKATGSFKEQPESTTVTAATTNSGSTETVLSSSSAAAPSTTEHLSTTTIAATTTTTTTTHKSVEEIKEAEEELKEKVAEIEAEPVILSARV